MQMLVIVICDQHVFLKFANIFKKTSPQTNVFPLPACSAVFNLIYIRG